MLASALSKPPQIQPYAPPSSLWTDLKVLYYMLFANVQGDTQQQRLESFYLLQADLYDSYRHRMLHARLPMIKAMPVTRGGTWVDLGGGTGSNLEYFGEQGLRYWGKVVVLDLCPSLVRTAQARVKSHSAAGWAESVSVVLGDACDFECAGLPPAGSVDVVTFSYALSMIPDWRKAIRNAYRLLKPGGHIAVCDFTVCAQQYAMSALFWTWLFANDHVHLRAEHIPTLQTAFETVYLEHGFGRFPYVPACMQAPWYAFVGQKGGGACPDLLG